VSDDRSAECVACEIVTMQHLRDSGYRHSGLAFELMFTRRDGKVICLPVDQLQRVREIIGELRPPEIRVLAGFDEDEARILAQIRGELPIFVH
jgi:hypothetical protein